LPQTKKRSEFRSNLLFPFLQVIIALHYGDKPYWNEKS